MIPINSADQVMELERRKQVIAVFVASGLDAEALTWVFNTWWELEQRSADRWHVVVPLNKLPQHNLDLDPSLLVHANFNVELAKELRQTYGVHDKDTPVLVFDDFNEEVHQRQVSLRDVSERKRVITDIETFMNSKIENEGKSVVFLDLGRRTIVGELVSYLHKQGLKKSTFSLVPKVGSALAKIAASAAAKEAIKLGLRSQGFPI